MIHTNILIELRWLDGLSQESGIGSRCLLFNVCEFVEQIIELIRKIFTILYFAFLARRTLRRVGLLRLTTATSE